MQRGGRCLARGGATWKRRGARSLSQPHGGHSHGISSQLCALQRDDFRHQRWQLFRVSLLEEARHLRGGDQRQIYPAKVRDGRVGIWDKASQASRRVSECLVPLAPEDLVSSCRCVGCPLFGGTRCAARVRTPSSAGAMAFALSSARNACRRKPERLGPQGLGHAHHAAATGLSASGPQWPRSSGVAGQKRIAPIGGERRTLTTRTAHQQMLALAHGDLEGVRVRIEVAGRVQLDGDVGRRK